MLARGVGGHGVHVAHAGEARRAGEVDDGAAAAAAPVIAVLTHVLEGRLDHQVRAFLQSLEQQCVGHYPAGTVNY